MAELRSAYDARVTEGEPFEDFVLVQAAIAAERAERQLVCDRYEVPRLVAEQISSSARFKEQAAALAQELGRSEPSCAKRPTS